VFVFWLACAATLRDLFKGFQFNWHPSLTSWGRDGHLYFTNEIYFTAFALDPCDFHCIVSDKHTKLLFIQNTCLPTT